MMFAVKQNNNKKVNKNESFGKTVNITNDVLTKQLEKTMNEKRIKNALKKLASE